MAHDWRIFENAAEEARLGVVTQLLGYCELARTSPTPRYREDVIARADYLLAHFEEVTSETAFDGMLGYALLGAHEITGDARYLAAATTITDRCRWLDGWTNTLNWGLMCALDLAAYVQVVPERAAAEKARRIVHSLAEHRQRDGSFPHICYYSTDVHYTAWMSAELILIARALPDDYIDKLLAGTHACLGRRIDPRGVTIYTDSLPPYGSSIRHYYSLGSGCVQDYDTRGWVNELGYLALVLDHAGDDRYYDVMAFLATLERNGAYPDKWDYLPDPKSPLYIWASAEESVIRSSMVFWMLAAIASDRARGRAAPPPAVAASAERIRSAAASDTAADAATANAAASAAPFAARLAAFPNPFAGSTVLDCEHSAGPARLTVCNARGEVVRVLWTGSFPAGKHQTVWDGRAGSGAPLPAGIYLARLETPERAVATKLVRLE